MAFDSKREADLDRDPASHLMRMIEMYRPGRRFSVAMMWAYFDETADETIAADGKKKFSNMIVGGCLAQQAAWISFNAEWTKALSDEGVKVFHAKKFFSYNSPFRWFLSNGQRDEKRHNLFRDKLANIIMNHTDELVGYSSAPSAKSKRPVRDAYAKSVVASFKEYSRSIGRDDDPVYIVLARHPELSQWTVLRLFEDIDWSGRLAGCGVFTPDDVPPLQAADFVLHAINQRWRNRDDNETYQILKEGAAKRNIRFSTFLGETWDDDEMRLPAGAGRSS